MVQFWFLFKKKKSREKTRHNDAYVTAYVVPGINANYLKLASGRTLRLLSLTASGIECNVTHELKMPYSIIFGLLFHLRFSEVSLPIFLSLLFQKFVILASLLTVTDAGL